MVRNKMKELRGERSQAAIAKKLNITGQMLGAIENGNRTPSLELAKKIADFYGFSIEEIFFEQKCNEMGRK